VLVGEKAPQGKNRRLPAPALPHTQVPLRKSKMNSEKTTKLVSFSYNFCSIFFAADNRLFAELVRVPFEDIILQRMGFGSAEASQEKAWLIIISHGIIVGSGWSIVYVLISGNYWYCFTPREHSLDSVD
jgi:hypothetical protein